MKLQNYLIVYLRKPTLFFFIYKIKAKMKATNKETIKYIVDNYYNFSIKELIEYSKLSPSTILKIAKNNNLLLKSAKKYVCNENYFEKIDNIEKAYWLGFLFADGYVRMHKGRSAELKLKLSINDKEHIKLFRKTLESTHPIKDEENVTYNNGKKSVTTCSFISVNSKKLVSDLYKNGCVNKKSFIIEFPNIDRKYYRHFIRGYFDGDGSIYVNNGRNDLSIVSASLIFLKRIQEILKNDINVTSKIYNEQNYHRLKIFRKNDVLHIYKYMYNYSYVFLERKKNKFKNINF